MHIHKFSDLVTFDAVAIGGTLPATDEYRSFFKNLHPRQLLTSRITAPFYEVTYGYDTCRDNRREGKKYVILRSSHGEEEIEIDMLFRDWKSGRKHMPLFPLQLKHVSFLHSLYKNTGCC